MRLVPALKPAPVVVVLLLAGCGSQATTKPTVVRPHLPRALAQDWARRADAVAAALAAGDGCLAQERAVALRASVVEHEGRLGHRFQEPLTSAVNGLAERITCTPPAPTPPEPQPPSQPQGHGHGKDHGDKGHHGKHKGHG
jgi:hypothetical protein